MPYVLITQCVRAVTPLWKSCELMIKSTHKVDASRVARAYAKPEDVAQDSVIISEFASRNLRRSTKLLNCGSSTSEFR